MGDELARFSKLFGALDDAARAKLMALAIKKEFQKGDVICREGDVGSEFFVLTRGSVTVTADDFGNTKMLATLTAGEYFGELGAIAGNRRQASVTAAESVEVLCFPPAAVNEVVKASPAAMTVMQKAGLQRTEDTMKKMLE